MTVFTETRHTSESPFEVVWKYHPVWEWTKTGERPVEPMPILFFNFAERAGEIDVAITQKSSFRPAEKKKKEERIIVIPNLEGINLHNPALTFTVRHLIRNFWAIVVSKALQTYFPVKRTDVAVFRDVAEKRSQVVLRIFTAANASQAVAFWESLESDIHEWISRLDERNRLVFVRDISLRIHWQ